MYMYIYMCVCVCICVCAYVIFDDFFQKKLDQLGTFGFALMCGVDVCLWEILQGGFSCFRLQGVCFLFPKP